MIEVGSFSYRCSILEKNNESEGCIIEFSFFKQYYHIVNCQIQTVGKSDASHHTAVVPPGHQVLQEFVFRG